MATELVGKWFVRLYGADGKLKACLEGHNLLTTNGKEALVSYFSSAAVSTITNTFKYIAIGTGTTSATVSDTGLGTETLRSTGTVSYVSGAIYQVTATFATNSGVGTFTEFGLFNTSNAGTLLSHDVENGIAKGSSDVLTLTYQLVFT